MMRIHNCINANNINCVTSFPTESKEIGVTIHVLSYNHEKSIKKCIESILMQKVNFGIEILIHDDHSSDASLSICLHYKKMYPNIIEVICEENNLYSKTNGVFEIESKLTDLSRGKYIALCEGDDYWTDDYKLYYQYHLMEANPGVCFCVHKVLVNNLSDCSKSFYPNKHYSTGILKSKNFIRIVNTTYSFQTSSYFFRTNDYVTFYKNTPFFAFSMPTNDESWLLYFGSKTDVLYINKVMSCYNKLSVNSWSSKSLLYNFEEKEKRRFAIIKALKEFNEYTNLKYKKSCERRICYNIVINSINNNDYEQILCNTNLSRAFWKINKKAYIKKWVKKYVFKK